MVGEWIKQAIHPLKWCHIYAPVVPHRMGKELLDCPAPYLLGIQQPTASEHFNSMTITTTTDDNVILIDLDRNVVRMSLSLMEMVDCSMRLVDKIAAILTPNLYGCDDVIASMTGESGKRCSEEISCHRLITSLSP